MSMGKISPTAPEFGHDFLAENGPKNHNQNMVLWGIDMTWELLIPLLQKTAFSHWSRAGLH